jgi:hypothetical protein
MKFTLLFRKDKEMTEWKKTEECRMSKMAAHNIMGMWLVYVKRFVSEPEKVRELERSRLDARAILKHT